MAFFFSFELAVLEPFLLPCSCRLMTAVVVGHFFFIGISSSRPTHVWRHCRQRLDYSIVCRHSLANFSRFTLRTRLRVAFPIVWVALRRHYVASHLAACGFGFFFQRLWFSLRPCDVWRLCLFLSMCTPRHCRLASCCLLNGWHWHTLASLHFFPHISFSA